MKNKEYDLQPNVPYYDLVRDLLAEKYPQRRKAVSAIDIATISSGIESARERYGEDSDCHLEYHSDEHSWEALQDYFVYADVIGLHDDEFVDGAIAIGWHDYEQSLGSGDNEKASAIRVQHVMDTAGYSTVRQIHAANCILATEVEFADGNIIQSNLESFGKDPTILAVSMADVYGIPKSGEKKMVEHALKLTMEINHLSFYQLKEDVSSFVDMLSQQYPFVSTRLSTLPNAVRFHIDDETEANRILSELEEKFGGASSMAINAAKSVYEKISSSREQFSMLLGDVALKASDMAAFVSEVASQVHEFALERKSKK